MRARTLGLRALRRKPNTGGCERDNKCMGDDATDAPPPISGRAPWGGKTWPKGAHTVREFHPIVAAARRAEHRLTTDKQP